MLNIYKPISLTPLQLIEKLKIKFPEYNDQKLAYAGRLDPMAEGVLLILVGDECKEREKYERLQKEYEFEVLWGFSTDTYDVMGRIQNTSYNIKHVTLNIQQIKKELTTYKGKFLQPYPPFSSARINGKPLYYWAREKKLDQIKIPSKEVEIYDIQYLGERYITKDELLKNITERIQNVEGKFRQEEIIRKWNQRLAQISNFEFLISNIKISCSSGTYVRSIANELGKKLGIPSLAYSIKRTNVGEFRIVDSIRL